MCKYKGTRNLITSKTVLQWRTLKARKGTINVYEVKAKGQTTTKYNVVHRLEQEPESVVQIQAKSKYKNPC